MIHAERVKLAEILAEEERANPNSSVVSNILRRIERSFPDVVSEKDHQRKRLIFHDMAEAMIANLSQWTNNPIRNTIRSYGNLANVLQEVFAKLDESVSPLESVLSSVKDGFMDGILQNDHYKFLVDKKFQHETANAFLKGNVLGFEHKDDKTHSNRLFVVARVPGQAQAKNDGMDLVAFSVPAPNTPMLFRIAASKELSKRFHNSYQYDVEIISSGIPSELKNHSKLPDIIEGQWVRMKPSELGHIKTGNASSLRDLPLATVFCICSVDDKTMVVPVLASIHQMDTESIIDAVAEKLDVLTESIKIIDVAKTSAEIAPLIVDDKIDISEPFEVLELPRSMVTNAHSQFEVQPLQYGP